MRERRLAMPAIVLPACGRPGAIVGDLDHDFTGAAADTDLRGGLPGVLEHVGQRFLHDPVGRDIHGRGQPRWITVDDQQHRQPSRAHSLGQRGQVGNARLRRQLR